MSMPKQQDLLNRMTFNVFGKGTTMPKTGNIVIKDIYIAIQQNNTEAVDRLFKENEKHHLSMSGLYLGIAGSLGYTDVIKTLIDNGADIDANAGIALCKAAEFDFKDTVDYLLSKSTMFLNRSLEAVAEKDNVEMFKYLVDKGADFKHNNDNVLKIAIHHNSEQVMKAIILDFNHTPIQDTQEWMIEKNTITLSNLLQAEICKQDSANDFPKSPKIKFKKMKI